MKTKNATRSYKLQSTKMRRGTNNQAALDNSEFLRKLKEDSLNSAVNELCKKINENGRLPKGTMSQVISDLKAVGIVTDRNRLNYLRKKRMKELGSTQQPEAERNLPVSEVECHHNESTTIRSISGYHALPPSEISKCTMPI